jgi:starch synthase
VRILFVASEVAPYAKTGGLADVAGALPRALRALGHDVRVFMPLYPRVKTPRVEVFPEHLVPIGKHGYSFALHKAAHEETYFVHCPAAYNRPSIYAGDGDEHLRFLLLSRAALEGALRIGFVPDVIHCNDWQTGLIPLLVKTTYPALARARTLLTIHNLGYQGVFPANVVPELGLGGAAQFLHQDDLRAGRIGFLLHGLLYADGLSTVSPSYAREIQTADQGFGLQDLLRARSSRLVGILNGIDDAEWNPSIDKRIPVHYDADSLDKKVGNKRALLQRVGLPPADEVPVFGIVSRMAAQKGFDLCAEVLPRLLAHVDSRVVVLGSGEPRLEQIFVDLYRRFPKRLRFSTGYDDDLAHLIEAGSDFFLMPSRYEPCGLNQLYSLRYGTVPIVHKTGGLADTVDRSVGFAFEHHDAAGLEWAIMAALATYRDPAAYRELQQAGMAKDYSWARQAQHYVGVYQRLQEI